MTHHSWLSPRIRGESISGIRLFWFTLLCITRSATLSSLLTLLRAALMIRRKNQTTHTRTYVYIYTWRTGSLESRKSGVIGWSFKRDVGVRRGRSTSEIESWHAIRLDAWLSTFHFPRSTRILENSNYLSPPFDFLLLLLLSSIFCPPSRAGSIDGRRTRFALEISKIGDHRAYRESSGMVGIFSEK